MIMSLPLPSDEFKVKKKHEVGTYSIYSLSKLTVSGGEGEVVDYALLKKRRNIFLRCNTDLSITALGREIKRGVDSFAVFIKI